MGYFPRKIDRSRARRETRALHAEAADAPVWTTLSHVAPARASYLRFATREHHPDSGRRRGFFDAAYALRDDPATDAHVAARLDEILRWFSENLPVPGERELPDERAVFLFKAPVTAGFARAWELAQLLRDAGVWVEMQAFERPGTIVYEDVHQVAVVPHRDEPRL